MAEERLAFSLELLLNAGEASKPLAVCEEGHLVVASRTHYAPERLTTDLKSLLMRWVEGCEA